MTKGVGISVRLSWCESHGVGPGQDESAQVCCEGLGSVYQAETVWFCYCLHWKGYVNSNVDELIG